MDIGQGRKWNLNRAILLTGGGCILLAAGLFYGAGLKEALFLLYLPMEGIGRLLRWLSLSSSGGNLIACALYGVLSLLPVFYLAGRILAAKKQSRLEGGFRQRDLLLVILSGYNFYMLYKFVNPATMQMGGLSLPGEMNEDLLPMIKLLLALVFYSLLVGWGILTFIRSFECSDSQKRIRFLFLSCIFMYVVYITYFMAFQLMGKLSLIETIDINYLLTVLWYFLKLWPDCMFVLILMAGMALIGELQTERYGAQGVAAAEKLARVSKNTVIISVLCGIIGNLLQVLFGNQILDINIVLDLPILPLVLAFAGILIAEYLKEGAELSEDRDMII